MNVFSRKITNIKKKIRHFKQRNNYRVAPLKFPGVTIESLRIASGEKSNGTKYLILFKSVHPRPDDMKYKQTIVRRQELSVSKKVFEKFQERFDDGKKDAWLYPRTTMVSTVEFVIHGITEKEVTPDHYNRLKSRQIARHEQNRSPEDPALKQAHIAYLESNDDKQTKMKIV